MNTNKAIKIITKIPGYIFALIGIALAMFSKLAGVIAFALWFVKQLINKSQWTDNFIKVCSKTIIIAIVIERLFTSWFVGWWWEYSRGGAKFHFEDFKTQEEMQQYLGKHYKINSSITNLLWDIETAGGKCYIQAQGMQPRKEFHYTDLYSCVYESSVSLNPFIEYIIYIYIDKNDYILFIDGVLRPRPLFII